MKPRKRVLLCVDLSYQSYRASAAHPTLSSDGVFTGGLFGFLTSMAKAIRETDATDVVICQDIKPYRRSEQYPDYKLLRKKSQDEELLKRHKESMPLILDTVQEIGLPVWGLKGYESDDLMGHVVHKYRHRYARIYAASNDSDLYQLLWARNFAVFKTELKDVVTAERLHLGPNRVTPDEFTRAHALMGTHNDIAGIPGVGPVNALKAVRDPGVWRRYMDGYRDVIERNLALIKLPHPEFPREAVLPTYTGEFSHRALYRSVGRYDITVTNGMFEAFRQVTKGTTDD